MLWSGCSLQPLQQQSIGGLGHFEYRESEPQAAGVVVGVPHAFNEPAALEYATAFSSSSGAGMSAHTASAPSAYRSHSLWSVAFQFPPKLEIHSTAAASIQNLNRCFKPSPKAT